MLQARQLLKNHSDLAAQQGVDTDKDRLQGMIFFGSLILSFSKVCMCIAGTDRPLDEDKLEFLERLLDQEHQKDQSAPLL